MKLLPFFSAKMSDAEPSPRSPEEEEEEEAGMDATPDSLEYAAPISALPPKVVQQEESQVEVSASPAFQCLDEVKRKNWGKHHCENI